MFSDEISDPHAADYPCDSDDDLDEVEVENLQSYLP